MNYVRIKNGAVVGNGSEIAAAGDAGAVYRALGCQYPKFFKMDSLCKWAWLGAEVLLRTENGWLYDGCDKTKIAVVLHTTNGCLEVDKRYLETLETVPSPALFVYTLPNIMLGEICIRHGFQGEQLCEMREEFDAEELFFWVKDLLEHRGMEYCLFGKVDAVGDAVDVCLFWADFRTIQDFSAEQMTAIDAQQNFTATTKHSKRTH